MKSWTKPTPEQVHKAVALLGRPEQSRYFFDRLQNPEWIQPLKEKGIYSCPPHVIKDERGVRIVPWPASSYLARMAPRSTDPSLIMDVILSIPDTENVRVRTDLVEAALGLPGKVAARLIPKAITWIDTPYNILLHDKLGDLIGHLALHGEIENSLTLAKELLTVGGRKDSAGYDRSEPKTRIELSDYKSVLETNLTILAQKAGMKVMELLSDFLDFTLELSIGAESISKFKDLSYIWRSAIEDHEQNHHHGVKDLLVSAIRDASVTIISSGIADAPTLVSWLEAKKWTIYRRLALHLMRRFPEDTAMIIAARLTNKVVFEDDSLRHEYALLLRERFRHLDEQEKNIILGWIEEGPDDVEPRMAFWERETGKAVTREDIDSYRRSWQLKQLSLISDSLSDSWKIRLRNISEGLEKPEHPEFGVYYSSGWVGPNSPRTADDLAALSAIQLSDYLSQWVPKQDEMGISASREGLAREVATAVARDPQRYVADTSIYYGLDPTYVRAILQGVSESLNKPQSFSWENVVALALWVVSQERSIAGRIVNKWNSDPDWGWTRKRIADLLDVGFRSDTHRIPITLRSKVLDILKVLIKDPNPEQENKEESANRQDDEGHDLQLAINSVRGSAFEAVIAYALWVRRQIEASPEAERALAVGFESMPEVRTALDAHLNLETEPSTAVRAVYGTWFPWLVLIDQKWSRDSRGKIFSSILQDIGKRHGKLTFSSDHHMTTLLKSCCQFTNTLCCSSRTRPRNKGLHARTSIWRSTL